MKNSIFQNVKNIFYSSIFGIIISISCVSVVAANVCFLPSGVCDEEIGEGKDGCTLLSPKQHQVCEKCEDGYYRCFGCEEGYKMVNGECVCDGDVCGSASSNGKDLRDTECATALNSCGLCPTGQCVCKGVKCESNHKCSKRENVCGNCEGKCICMNCCYELGDGWVETKPDGCSLEKRTLDSSKTCYKKVPCGTCKDKGWQDNNQCDAGKTAQAMDIINGVQCYLCVDDNKPQNCAAYSESYYENPSSCTSCEKAKQVDASKVGGLTCYECKNVTCDELGYDDAKNSECYKDNEEKCKNPAYNQVCWINTNAKKCSERGLADSMDTTCFKKSEQDNRCPGQTCWLNSDAKSCAEIWGNENYYENKPDGADCTLANPQKCGKICYSCPPKSTCALTVDSPLKTFEDKNQTEFVYVTWTLNKPDCEDGDLDTKEIDGCTYYFCQTWQNCEDLGYKSRNECIDEGKQAVKVAGISGSNADEFCYICKNCSEINGSYKDIVTDEEGKESMPCPSAFDNQYQGMPVDAGESNIGMKCYACNDTRCSGKGYLEVTEKCPADKPNPHDIWIEDYGKKCRECGECPDTLPAEDSLDDGFVCCDTCQDKDGNRRCKSVEEGDVCPDSCEKAGYTIQSCPTGTKTIREKVGDKWCIVDCTSSSSSGGGGGGGDTFSDGGLCGSCCLKDSKNDIIMRTGAPGECRGVCNDNDCCTYFHTCGFRGGDSSTGIKEGTCNPQNSNFDIEGVLNCAQGYECVWDGGAAPYTQGHCKPWADDEDLKKAYISDDSTPCGGKCQSPNSLCCVIKSSPYDTQSYCVSSYNDCLDMAGL